MHWYLKGWVTTSSFLLSKALGTHRVFWSQSLSPRALLSVALASCWWSETFIYDRFSGKEVVYGVWFFLSGFLWIIFTIWLRILALLIEQWLPCSTTTRKLHEGFFFFLRERVDCQFILPMSKKKKHSQKKIKQEMEKLLCLSLIQREYEEKEGIL